MTAHAQAVLDAHGAYSYEVILALISSKGLDSFQAVGLTSRHDMDLRAAFDQGVPPMDCAADLIKSWRAQGL